MVKHLAAAGAALVAGALWTCNAIADEVAPPPPDLTAPATRWGNRMLAGHTFLYPVTHAGAFVTTYFGVAEGVYDESIPAVPIPGARTTDLSLIGVTSTANLGIKITDWLGIEAQGRALAVFGLNGQSLIYAGGDLNSGGFVAPIVRLARIESSGTQISARAQMGWLAGTTLQVPRLLVLARTAVAGAAMNTTDPAAAARDIGMRDHPGRVPARHSRGRRYVRPQCLGRGRAGAGRDVRLAGGRHRAAPRPRAHVQRPGVGGLSQQRDPLRHALRHLRRMGRNESARAHRCNPRVRAQREGWRARATRTSRKRARTRTRSESGVYYSGRPNLQVGLFAATIRNLRPIAGVNVAGGPGTSGTPNAQFAEMVLRYVW